MPRVPSTFPVRPLRPFQPALRRMTCGTCGRSWDDAIPTEYTPAPSARCPFEEFHRPNLSKKAWKELNEPEQLRKTIVEWKNEVIRLTRVVQAKDALIKQQEQTIINVMLRIEALQKLVLSYQQDNEKDYLAAGIECGKEDK